MMVSLALISPLCAQDQPIDMIFSDRFEPFFQDCAECPTMVRIPAGTFTQGSPEGEGDGFGYERPQRTVDLPAFAIGQTTVTFEQWDACVADGGCTHVPDDNGWGRGDRPVINVNWNNAQQYVTWLSHKTGYHYRLPSESEWEYATRAGTTDRFNTGECITTDQANFRGELPAEGCPTGINRGQTLPVGSFGPNAFGLYDTHGNVWEWIQDCSNENYVGAPTDGSAWMTGDCSLARLRGGSWFSIGQSIRSASRGESSHGTNSNQAGFRVARTVVKPFQDCPDCPTLVMIPTGTFTQGSPASEPQSQDNERPQRQVKVPAFGIGQTEVTFEQWDACVADGGCTHEPDDNGWGRGDRPVINVSWNDAREYVTWLSNKTGHHYRLPSESEREYVTRAGTSSRFNTGDCITTDQANFYGFIPAENCPSGIVHDQTLPVASFAANAFSLHDTHGNVLEWVQDCWHDDYVDAPTDGSAWMSSDCNSGVVRGGSWGNMGRALRSAKRNYGIAHSTRNDSTGFRVARTIVKPFQDCPDCPTMVMIPARNFTQGSPASEPQSQDNERPQRQVSVPAFAMGQTAVTFDQWDACVNDGGCTHNPDDQGWGRGDRPVINVNWNDTQEYLTWLRDKTGKDYRLPSESEWEYATRAGTIGRFNTGDCISSDQAKIQGASAAHGCPTGINRGQTLPVRSFAPNAFGLYETHGNVWERVQDCWNENYVDAPTDGSAWTSGDCSLALTRGGSWAISGGWVRSAIRAWSSRDLRSDQAGFRVARSNFPPLPDVAQNGLVDWFNPNHGLIVDGDGRVEKWTNLANEDRSTSASSFARKFDGVDGHRIVRFRSPLNSGHLAYPSPGTEILAEGYTVFVVFRLTDPLVFSNSFPRLWRGANDSHALFLRRDNGEVEIKANPLPANERPNHPFDASYEVGDFAILTARLTPSSQQLFFNGLMVAGSESPISAYTIDSLFQIGNSVHGDFGDVLVYDHSASLADLDETGQALAEAYGTTWQSMDSLQLPTMVMIPAGTSYSKRGESRLQPTGKSLQP
ncbi:MAG: formylglycine-generating enzyme family protein [Wenzhouxiangella sp.]|nr:formylglycine-generating enzyme family protein [Wenzhouxiangella sp.]